MKQLSQILTFAQQILRSFAALVVQTNLYNLIYLLVLRIYLLRPVNLERQFFPKRPVVTQ